MTTAAIGAAMSEEKHMRIVRALLVAVAVCGATLSAATAAHAAPGWAPPKDGIDAKCSGYYEIQGLKVQECVVVSYRPNDSWVQSILAVSNRSSVSRRVRGETDTYWRGSAGARRLVHTNCKDRTIAAGGRQWCWGKWERMSGHGVPMFGIGLLYDYRTGRRAVRRSPEKLS
jgi:hypothetical protein